MEISVSDNGDLVIPRELVERLSAGPGDLCHAELNETGAIVSVSLMDPGVARAYGTLQVEGDTDDMIRDLRRDRQPRD